MTPTPGVRAPLETAAASSPDLLLDVENGIADDERCGRCILAAAVAATCLPRFSRLRQPHLSTPSRRARRRH